MGAIAACEGVEEIVKLRGDGSIFRRGRVWWIQFHHRGRQHQESSRSDRRAAAERLLRRRRAEIEAEREGLRRFGGPKADRVTIGEILDDYVDAYREKKGLAEDDSLPAWVRTRVRLLRETPVGSYRTPLGELRAVAVDEETVRKYLKARGEEFLRTHGRPIGQATLNREKQVLRAAFRIAERETKKIPPGTAPCIRIPREKNVRRGFFETEDFEAVIGHLPDEFQEFARFAFWTGMRKGGVAALRWADVDRNERTLLLRPEDDKTGYGVPLQLPAYLWAIIERRWEARIVEEDGATRISEWIFHRDGFQVRYKSFDRHWNRALEAAGILAGRKGWIFHDLRRTAVRNMRRAGVEKDVIMKIAGMKTDAIFHRYSIVDGRDIEEGLERTVQHVLKEKAGRKVVKMEPRTGGPGGDAGEEKKSA